MMTVCVAAIGDSFSGLKHAPQPFFFCAHVTHFYFGTSIASSLAADAFSVVGLLSLLVMSRITLTGSHPVNDFWFSNDPL
jgi:hypothetical protein